MIDERIRSSVIHFDQKQK